jgi:uncharacterized iron-regulated membrane protein
MWSSCRSVSRSSYSKHVPCESVFLLEGELKKSHYESHACIHLNAMFSSHLKILALQLDLAVWCASGLGFLLERKSRPGKPAACLWYLISRQETTYGQFMLTCCCLLLFAFNKIEVIIRIKVILI